MPLQHARVYESLAGSGVAYSLPNDWRWLSVDTDCLELEDATATFEQLAEEFPPEELRASGVASQTEEGELVLSPNLTDPDAGFIVLRNGNGDPFDIATSAGCVSNTQPALKFLHDRTAKRGLEASENRVLYGTFTMLDTVVLRSLGVPAAPAARLEVLTLPGLQRLLCLVGGSAEGDIPKQRVQFASDEEEDRQPRYEGQSEEEPGLFTLVLLAGSVASATAEIPEGLTAVARRLADAERHLGFSWQRIAVWHPTPRELGNLSYRLELGSADALRRFFLTYRARHRLEAFTKPGPPSISTPKPAEIYFDLLEKLKTRPSDPFSSLQRTSDPRRLRKSYDTFVDRHYVGPFVDKAMQSNDPEERALYMEMASKSRLYHRVMPAVYDTLAQSAGEIRGNEDQFLPAEVFKQLDSLGGQLLKLIRQHAAILRDKWHSGR